MRSRLRVARAFPGRDDYAGRPAERSDEERDPCYVPAMNGLVDPSGRYIMHAQSISRAAAWFRTVLRDNGVKLHGDCYMATALRAIDALAAFYGGDVTRLSVATAIPALREGMALVYLAKAMHRAWPRIEHALRPRLRHLRKGDLGLMRAASPNEPRNILWEMLVASLAADFASGVLMREPDDVVCEFQGQPWVLTCKCLYSDKPSKQQDRIVEGARQIEATKTNGLVIVNVTNLVDHDLFLWTKDEKIASFAVDTDPGERLAREMSRIADAINFSGLRPQLVGGPEGPRRRTRGVVLMAQAASSVQFGVRPLGMATRVTIRTPLLR